MALADFKPVKRKVAFPGGEFEVRALSPDLYDRYLQLRTQMNPVTRVPNTAGEALAALNCGELCAPQAITTYPFHTERTERSASVRTNS